MNWQKLSDKLPLIHHSYYWQVKGGLGGYDYYDVNGFTFPFEDFEPTDEEIFWLDEESPDVELTVNELKGVLKEYNGSKFTLEFIVRRKIKELEESKQLTNGILTINKVSGDSINNQHYNQSGDGKTIENGKV